MIHGMGLMDYIYEHTWHGLPPRHEITAEQRLWAAILWGGVLPFVIVLIMVWRLGPVEIETVARAACTGILLQVLLLIPPVGRHIYLLVLRIFSIVGFFVSHTLLILFFYLVITPTGFCMRLAGRDALHQRNRLGPTWNRRKPNRDRKRFYRMF